MITLLGLLLAVIFGSGGYWVGSHSAQKQMRIPQSPKMTVSPKSTAKPAKKALFQTVAIPYAISYTIPQGFSTILWHPTPISTASAIVSPDYIPFKSPSGVLNSDPDPQGGMGIFIIKKPNPIDNLSQLKVSTQTTEEGMQQIAETTVGGYPAYFAIYLDSDSDRILYDYHILYGTDEWVIRIVFPGLSLSAAQQEYQRYSAQINDFLQSIQFLQYYT